jgi:hypothetical protein
MMAIETAAAILTKLAFEQNSELRSKLVDVNAEESALIGVMMPLFRRILRQLQDDLQAYDTFPSSPTSAPPAASDPGQ